MIIVELSSCCRRQPTVGGADSSVSPVTHIISPDHSLQLSHSVFLRFVLTAVEQLFFHSCPHTFTACIIMTSSAGTVHALNDSDVTTDYILGRCASKTNLNDTYALKLTNKMTIGDAVEIMTKMNDAEREHLAYFIEVIGKSKK